MDDPINEAKEIIEKCFGEYKEKIPRSEIYRGFSLLPLIVSKYDKLDKTIGPAEIEAIKRGIRALLIIEDESGVEEIKNIVSCHVLQRLIDNRL